MMEKLKQNMNSKKAMRFASRTKEIGGEGAAGWAIADAAADAAGRGEDVISLCLGDTSFDTPSTIVEAAISNLRRGRTHYAPVPGTPELRKAIADSQGRFDSQNWDLDHITVFAGAQNALFAAMMSIAGPDDEVLYFEPWYATYEATIRAGGATAKPVKLSLKSNEPKISERNLLKAVNGRTRAILLNSPNNPGGYVLDREELEIIAAIAKQHNLWIISDEVYRHAVFDGEFVSAASLSQVRERTIIVNSLSKSHAMTGWRVGWTIAPRAASEHLYNLAQCMLFGSPTFIQDAAVTALHEDSDQDMYHFSSELRQRRNIMCTALSQIRQLKFDRPAGGMFCFVDVSETKLSGTEFAERLFASERLAVVPGIAFGPMMAKYIRISFSGSEEVIIEGMTRLKKFCFGL